jgi:drug/metabolite transporter (DMT)-like permease
VFEVVVASLGYAGGVVADKFVLSRYKVPVMRFMPLLFIWLAIITGIFLSRWGGFSSSALKDWRYIGLFVLMILVAVIWNVLYYQGVQKEDLHELELIMLLSPLVTIIFATMFLPSEREWRVFVPGIIATFALLATRFRKHHIKIGQTAWRTIAAMLLMSFESILIKELLNVFSPVMLYFVRTLFIAIIFLVLYRPKLMSMPRNAFALTILSAVFGVVQMVLKFYGFQSLGVIETTMILILGPFLVYAASSFFFREHLYKRDILAATIVVTCILYVQFWR